MVYFSGNTLSLDPRTTSRLRVESDTPESRTAKWVAFPKIMCRNSNCIDSGVSGNTSSTTDEALLYAFVRSGGTFVSDCAEILSGNATVEVRMAQVPPLQECYVIRHQPMGLFSGFATAQSVFLLLQFFDDCCENLSASFAARATPLFLLKTDGN